MLRIVCSLFVRVRAPHRQCSRLTLPLNQIHNRSSCHRRHARERASTSCRAASTCCTSSERRLPTAPRPSTHRADSRRSPMLRSSSSSRPRSTCALPLSLSLPLCESKGLELIDGDDGGRAGERAVRVSSGAGIEREDGASGVVRASVVELVPSVGLPGRRLWRSVRSARLLDRISRCHRFVSLSLSLSLARALCERRRGCLLLCTRLIDRLMDGAL